MCARSSRAARARPSRNRRRLSIRWPAGRLGPLRGALTYLAAASLTSALLVSLLKQASAHTCPWDLALFGGRYDFYPLLGKLPADPGPGRCVPSGQASAGFMWFAAIYAVRRLPTELADRLRPGAVACAVVAFGVAVSAAQVVRGAHFVSHVLLSAAVCWAVAWLFDLR